MGNETVGHGDNLGGFWMMLYQLCDPSETHLIETQHA